MNLDPSSQDEFEVIGNLHKHVKMFSSVAGVAIHKILVVRRYKNENFLETSNEEGFWKYTASVEVIASLDNITHGWDRHMWEVPRNMN